MNTTPLPGGSTGVVARGGLALGTPRQALSPFSPDSSLHPAGAALDAAELTMKLSTLIHSCRLGALGFVLSNLPASAQCLDWTNDFSDPLKFVNGAVWSFATYDDGGGPALYAAGDFNIAGGTYVNSIAKWDGSSWTPLDTGMNSTVACLLTYDDGSGEKLYAGGSFSTAGGTNTGRLARWDGVSWSSFGGGIPGGMVRSLAAHDDGTGPGLYAGGSFSQAGFAPAANIAVWKSGSWSALGLGTGGGVYSLASFDSGQGPTLYVGGVFTSVAGVASGCLAHWRNSNWTGIGGIPGGGNNVIRCLTPFLDGGVQKLFVGGTFDFVNGASCRNLTRWTGTGFQSCSPLLTRDGPVHALAVHDDGTGPALYAAGAFNVSGNTPPEGNVARWSGSIWTPLGTGVFPGGYSEIGKALHSTTVLGSNRLLLGGSFSKAGGKLVKNVAAWGEPCSAPVVVVHPQPVTAVFNQQILMGLQALGTAPVTYQWRRNGQALVDDAHRLGSTTTQLTLLSYTYADHGDYDCVVSNGFGSTTSNLARLTVPVSGTSGAPLHLRKVVYPPEPVSTLPPGNNFEWAYDVQQARTREQSVMTKINGELALVLFDQGSPLVKIKGGDPAPFYGPGVDFPGIFSGFSPVRFRAVADSGQLTVQGDLTGWAVTQDTRQVIWYLSPGGTVGVVREGDPAVGFAPGMVHRMLSESMISDTGRVAFKSQVFQNGQSVSYGLWTWDAVGGRQLLAKPGDLAPGAPAHYTYLDPKVRLNTSGTAAFTVGLDTITGLHTLTTFDSAVIVGIPGALQRAVSSGDPAPGMPPGSNLEGFSDAEIDDLGGVRFSSLVALGGGGNQRATYHWYQGTVTPIATRSDVFPDLYPGSTLLEALPWDSNVGGSTLLKAIFSTNCPQACPVEGLWLRSTAGLETVGLRGGVDYPGMPAGFVVMSIDSAALNSADQVVFQITANLGTMNQAIYGWTRDVGLFPIAAPGGQYDIGTGEFRTISRALLTDPLGVSQGNRGTSLDDAGQVSFRVEFTDGTAGVFWADLNVLASAHGNTGDKYCFGDGGGTACPCGNLGLPGQGCANSSGQGADLIGLGSTSVFEDDLRFLTTHLPPNKPCLLLQGGSTAGGGAGVVLSDGLLCVGAPIRRLVGGLSTPQGEILFGPGLSAAGLWVAGQARYFQVWYRNPTGPCGSGSNLSNAFSVVLLP